MDLEARFRLLAENASDVVFITDTDGVFTWLSPSVEPVLGWAPDLVVGRRAADFVVPDDLPALGAAQARVLAGEDARVEVRMNRPDGGSTWVQAQIRPLVDPSGVVIGRTGSIRDISAERTARDALRRSEQRVRAALHALRDAVVVHGPDGRVIYASPSCERVLGIGPDQLVGSERGSHGVQPVAPDGRPLGEDDDPVLRTLRTGEPCHDVVTRIEHPLRSTTWLRISTEPMREDDGTVGGVVASIADITEQWQREEALRLSEERFRVALDALGEGVIVLRSILDRSGALEDVEVVWANEQLRSDWFGPRPLEELVGRALWSLEPAVSQQRLMDRYRHVVATGRAVRDEVAYRDRHGQPRHLDATIVPFAGGLLHLGRDVTEKHRISAQLEEAYQIAELGVWSRDVATRTATWSPEMYRIFRRDPALGPMSPGDLLSIAKLAPEQWAAEVQRQATGSADSWETEIELRRDDGSSFWILNRSRADHDAAGRVVAYHGTTLDVTARKIAQQTSDRVQQELEERVAARTADLEAANEELRAFSYSLSHDLRAPLRSIAGFAALLLRRNAEQLDEDGRHRLDNIQTAASSMGRVIDDLLQYLRLGREGLRLQPVPLGPVVDGLQLAHADLLARVGGRLELRLPAAVPLADPTMLFEILSNLVENGLQYARPGVAPVVRVQATQAGDQVDVTVTDNGAGIAPADRERIFEAFTRLAGDEAHPGTGIGLAVARRAARAMDTEIHVDSWVGEGSVFRIPLPAAPTR
ncbi:MAG: PAS domain S-box protein [Chloroflexota bacterium]